MDHEFELIMGALHIIPIPRCSKVESGKPTSWQKHPSVLDYISSTHFHASVREEDPTRLAIQDPYFMRNRRRGRRQYRLKAYMGMPRRMVRTRGDARVVVHLRRIRRHKDVAIPV